MQSNSHYSHTVACKFVRANSMAQNQSTPALTTTATTPGAELLQAQAELWCHMFGYLKPMALQCAIKLGIPNIISRHGGAASLSELCAALPVAPSKRTCLSRLMRLLATLGILREEKETSPGGQAEASYLYHLTAVSRLLVDEDDGGHPCLSAFMANIAAPFHVVASLCLAEWFKNDGGAATAETPFMMAHGTSFWGVVVRDAQFAADFYASMRADSRFVAQIIVSQCREVFADVNSLVDVGGGEGTMAKAIAKAFPHVRCSVLDLPQVVRGNGMPGEGEEGTVEFIEGDMMVFIPPADAVLLKSIFHDWGDEDCVRILKQCKEAISTREPKGKVIIVDTVIGSASKRIFEEAQLLMDLNMMVLVPGKERDEEKWSKMFMDAGFTKYKISPILEPRSLIEVYP
ncbi:trans-resveratrol di-O-methyltransferase-like [Miscanthus floridulus]|uniref:trans-resveratrol di-O-methyltransferase-like n=1 Tax=Miscanthus floridulus TaxID=154761 RepID=UPI0034589D15